MQLMMTFKERLRDELNFQDITVKELASTTGIKKGTIDSYLSVRNSIPTADNAVKIARALNITVECLITGIDKKKVIFLENHLFKKYRMLIENLEIIPKEIANPLLKAIQYAALSERRKKRKDR